MKSLFRSTYQQISACSAEHEYPRILMNTMNRKSIYNRKS